MYQRSLLRAADVEPLGDAVVTVLEKVGAMYQNDPILDAMDRAGGRVDRSTNVATSTDRAPSSSSGARTTPTPSASWRGRGR